MKYIFLFTCWMACTFAFGECNNSQITIPVDFMFSDSQYQTDWVYNSLDPVLQISQDWKSPDNLSISAGSLYLVFCAPRDISGTLTFAFGPRHLSTSVRPIGPNSTMSAIHFQSQPAPTWPILHSATWAQAQDGSPLITISIENPAGAAPLSRVPVHLILTTGPVSCFGAPSYEDVQVKVSIDKNAPTVWSKDEHFPEEVKRQASLKSKGCDVDADLELGTIDNVNPNSTLNLRFKLTGPTLIYRGYHLYSKGEVPGRVVMIANENVFPMCMIAAGGYNPPLSALIPNACIRSNR